MPQFNTLEEAIDIHAKHHGYSEGRVKHFTPGTEFFDMHRKRIGWIVEQIPESIYLLDIGCSGGEFITYIKSLKDIDCIGIDVNESAVKAAISQGVFARVGRAESLPFSDNRFDVVLLSEVLEHLYDPLPALKEANRVMRDGGVVLGSVPHKDSFMLQNKSAKDYMFHARDYTPELLRSHLETYFDNVIIKTVLVNLLDHGQSPFWLVFKGVKK